MYVVINREYDTLYEVGVFNTLQRAKEAVNKFYEVNIADDDGFDVEIIKVEMNSFEDTNKNYQCYEEYSGPDYPFEMQPEAYETDDYLATQMFKCPECGDYLPVYVSILEDEKHQFAPHMDMSVLWIHTWAHWEKEKK